MLPGGRGGGGRAGGGKGSPGTEQTLNEHLLDSTALNSHPSRKLPFFVDSHGAFLVEEENLLAY